MTLAERLTAAEKRVAQPRRAAMELQSAYDAAVADRDHIEAARLQPVLETARVDLAIAEATVATLRQLAADASQAWNEQERAARAAQLQEAANKILGDAIVEDAAAMAAIGAAVQQMYDCMQAAQAAFRDAQAQEDRAHAARMRAGQARAQIAGQTGQLARVSKPNAATAIADRVPAVGVLMQWRR